MLSPEAALIYAMVAAVGSARTIVQDEIGIIGDLVDHLPFFHGIGRREVSELAVRGAEQIARPGGIERAYGQIRNALSGRLREAAYALSCDVIALRRPEKGQQALERIRTQLEIDPLTARTIERAARARCQAEGAYKGASGIARPFWPAVDGLAAVRAQNAGGAMTAGDEASDLRRLMVGQPELIA
jgi:hypothetical protein